MKSNSTKRAEPNTVRLAIGDDRCMCVSAKNPKYFCVLEKGHDCDHAWWCPGMTYWFDEVLVESRAVTHVNES